MNCRPVAQLQQNECAMRVVPDRHVPRLTYCLNVHPGERFQDQWDAVRVHADRIRGSLSREPSHLRALCELPGQSGAFGLGLRLGGVAADEALAGDHAESFGAWCREKGFGVFTINGFPFGRFHGTKVKADVYRPDWTTPERSEYTIKLARLLAGWLVDDGIGSISTVPGWYGPDYPDPASKEEAHRRAFTHLLDVAHVLERLSGETGCDLCLGLEPEPWCVMETLDDAVRFLQDGLFKFAGPEAEEVVRRRIGVCVDTCHCALAFEDPAVVLETFQRKGIRVAKVQLSAALAFEPGDRWAEPVSRFVEPVYFHQTAASVPGGCIRWPDLPEAITDLSSQSNWTEARVHFHVPLHWDGGGGLRSTRANMTPAFWRLLQKGICPHLEIETYTFDVLPPELRTVGVADSVTREYLWVLKHMRPEAPESCC